MKQHAPGTGIHPEDLNALTEYWLRETNYINDKFDESLKSAQDDAYSRGYRRGREDLIEIRNQRDELLAALEKLTHNTFETYDDVAELAFSAIASVKGGAA